MTNIFIELELFLDPQIKKAEAMRKHLESEKIPFWQNNLASVPRYEVFIDRAKKYIAAGFPQLEEQGKSAYIEKYGELEEQAKIVISSGVSERKVKNLMNDFKKFFREDTIKQLVQLESSSACQSGGEFGIPDCPNSLKCDQPVSLADMVKIYEDLGVATDGKCDSVYKLLDAHEREKTTDILVKATKKAKEINDISQKDIKANALNRLAQKFMLYFKNDNERNKYDVAIKRYRFDEFANKKLKHYVDGWVEEKKTDWKQYHVFIDEVKKLGYTEDEAKWLVYEFFCLAKPPRKCPLPVPPEKKTPGGFFGAKKSPEEKKPLPEVLADAVKNVFG